MSKQIVVLYGSEAREKLAKGFNFLADAVKLTLGPSGRNALMEKGTRITNDGYSIAKEIQLDDPIEDLGLKSGREACVRANEEAGDGTTTAITLAQAIFKEMSKYLGKGVIIGNQKSPPELRAQVFKETLEVVGKLKAMAQPVKSEQELVEIAKVSVEDDNLAELIGKTQWNLGKNGKLRSQDSNDLTDSVEIVPGVRSDNGFAIIQQINNQEKQRVEVNNVKIIVTSHPIRSLLDVQHILEPLVKTGVRDLVIVARAFTEEAVIDIGMNWKNNNKFYAINAPYFDYKEMLEDIAVICGAKFIDSEQTKLSDMQLSDLGMAKRVEATQWTTDFVAMDDVNKDKITERINILKEKLKGSQSEFEKKNLEVRIAQLENGFAVIKIGGYSQADKKYKQDKVDDAVNAVKHALNDGTVRGGGLALKEISDSLPDSYLLKEPLLAPYQQIVINGTTEIPDWVRDPLKVVKIGLERAASVAANLATAEIAIAERRKTRLEKYFTDKDTQNAED